MAYTHPHEYIAHMCKSDSRGKFITFKSYSKDSETVLLTRTDVDNRYSDWNCFEVEIDRTEAEKYFRKLKSKSWFVRKLIDPDAPPRPMNGSDSLSHQNLGNTADPDEVRRRGLFDMK